MEGQEQDRKGRRNGIHGRLKSMKLQEKLLLAYGCLAILPMLIITFYTYTFTKNTLLRQTEENVTARLNQTESGLEHQLERCNSILNSLYADKILHNYLSMNYNERGFEDLYYYLNQLITGFHVMNPEMTGIEIYSSNATLFHDKKYLYQLDRENPPEWYQELLARDGKTLLLSEPETDQISAIRTLNLYESGSYVHVVKLSMGRSVFQELFECQTASQFYLVSRKGLVIAGTSETSIGSDYVILAVKDLESREFSRELSTGDLLYLRVDMAPLLKTARDSAWNIIKIFLISSGIAIFCIYLYSVYFKRNVQKVMRGARKIGEGEFFYKIQKVPEDEIGEIADSINQLGEQLHTLIEESYKKELERKRSELNLLQEQINPHFLYNALSSISSMTMKNGDRDSNEAIASLADFYRISLNNGKMILTIREELELLKRYLKIQKIRFGDVIFVEYELDESLLDDTMIKLVLQPIVENAIHHGRNSDEEEFHIHIKLFREDGKHVFEIEDDGAGMDAGKLSQLQESLNRSEGGHGLRNVNFRIKLQYGNEYGVCVESEYGFGTIVRVEFP